MSAPDTLPFNYAHMWEEMYKGIDEQGPYYEVIYLFDDWADSDTVVNTLIGTTTRSAGFTIRNLPHVHPLSPNLYCKSARVEGVGKPVLNALGYPVYDSGFKVRATYRASMPQGVLNPLDDPDNNQQIDPTTPILWCTQELDFDTDPIEVRNSNYTYLSDGMRVDHPVKKDIGLTIMRLTFHRLPYLPTPLFRTKRGKINSNVFLGGPAQCVLFKGASTSREYNTDGTVVQKCSMTFIEREFSWNKIFRPDTLAWDNVIDGSSLGPFTVTDLAPLLAV